MTVAAASPQTVPDRNAPARSARDLLVIFFAGLFIYGWKLGVAPLAGTEPLRALVAHQMVQGGDYLVPRIYGEL